MLIPEFRVWDKERKEMCPVLRLTWPLPEPDTLSPLMQFTGILDKNRNKIFVGDIIKTNLFHIKEYGAEIGVNYSKEEGIFEIYYSPFHASFEFLRCNKTNPPFDKMQPHWVSSIDFEIIGNIYEKPDLNSYKNLSGVDNA